MEADVRKLVAQTLAEEAPMTDNHVEELARGVLPCPASPRPTESCVREIVEEATVAQFSDDHIRLMVQDLPMPTRRGGRDHPTAESQPVDDVLTQS